MYLSAIHLNYDNISARQAILENLIDEELGDDNHPELWLHFGEGVGKNPRAGIYIYRVIQKQKISRRV